MDDRHIWKDTNDSGKIKVCVKCGLKITWIRTKGKGPHRRHYLIKGSSEWIIGDRLPPCTGKQSTE